jgi:sugar phosphate isomerase/epimerase
MSIAFRIPWSSDVPRLPELAHWAADHGFGALDLGATDKEKVDAVRGAGLEIGTFDLMVTSPLLSPDPEVRRTVIPIVTEAALRAKDLGLTRAFGVFVPRDRTQSRGDSFRNWSESWPAVSEILASAGIDYCMEGWPGDSPAYPALGVTPETVRAMLAVDAAKGAGALKLNYDPSHLVRVGVDPLRFLSEFGSSVRHVHGKDTAFDAARLYETGNLGASLPADYPGSAAKNQPDFSEGWWRYCVPGEGVVPWNKVAAILSELGYTGHVSVELEDSRYNGSWAGEQRGLTNAQKYLAQYFG